MAQLKCTNVLACCNGATIFSVDGANGRLLEVTDDLSNSIFSANTIAGLPVIEAFANNCVSMGQFGGHKLEVTCTSIIGGIRNTVLSCCSVISGGSCNTICAGANTSVIGGGCCNLSCCDARTTTISGGYGNTVSNFYSTVGGGLFNSATGYIATVGGGRANSASGTYSTIAGGRSSVADGSAATIAGGRANSASGTYSTIAGGFANTASGYGSFIGGGNYNRICSGIGASSIVGGGFNTVLGGSCNIHIIGFSICGNTNNYTYVNNLCQVGGGISDCRVKNTICNTGFGLQEIVKLRPVSYCFNGDDSKKFGFIAQEVQEVIPEIVKYNPIEKVGKDGRRTVVEDGDPLLEFDKEAIFTSYVNAFKDLKAENDALKQRIDTIENILKQNGLL